MHAFHEDLARAQIRERIAAAEMDRLARRLRAARRAERAAARSRRAAHVLADM